MSILFNSGFPYTPCYLLFQKNFLKEVRKKKNFEKNFRNKVHLKRNKGKEVDENEVKKYIFVR